MANMAPGIQLGGLGSAMPDPVGDVMERANPLSGLGAVQADISSITDSLYGQSGDVDALAMMRRGMLQAQGTMDSLGARLPGAEQSAAEGRAALLARLQQQYSPERESQLNWQALSNMGAAMMQPANDAQPGGQTQWSRGQQAFQAQRNENQKTLDKSGNDLAVAQQALSDDQYKQLLEQYKLAQTDYKDNRAGIVDWQRAIKVAMGGTRWGTNVGPGGLWLIDKQADDPTKAITLVDPNYFKKETAVAMEAIQKDADGLADAFTQQAADLTAKGNPITAAELRDQYVKSRMEIVFQTLQQNPTGKIPDGPTLQNPIGTSPVATTEQALPLMPEQAPAVGTAEAPPSARAPTANLSREGYKGITPAMRAELTAAAKLGSTSAIQILEQDLRYRQEDAAKNRPLTPVVNTPVLEGAKKTATEEATAESKRKWEKDPQYNSTGSMLDNLALLRNAANNVLNQRGIDTGVGVMAGKAWVPTVRGKTGDFESSLDTLKSKVGFQVLAAMREASKTGGALGNVSDTEVKFLQSNLAALMLTQTPAHFREQLKIILDWIDTTEGRIEKSFRNLYPDTEPPRTIVSTSKKGVSTDLPRTNAKGWILHKDAAGIQAYVGPNGEVEEVQ